MSLRKIKSYRLGDLIQGLDVTLKGDPDCVIEGVCTINEGKPNHISFLANSRYRKYLAETKASALIVSEQNAAACQVNAIISQNPYYVYAKIAEFFESAGIPFGGVHQTAVIGEGCQIDPTASIGAHCVIGNNVKIGSRTIIGAGSIVEDHAVIGDDTKLDAHVIIYHDVMIGKRTHIASGVVIGSDGFGFANHKNTWKKVPQLGTVIIGDDVDIGANTTIDRRAVENTMISNGVKLDNLIQIGHNVHIGDNTIIAGCTGVAGSTVIGKNCMIGGAVMVAGHIEVGDNVMVTGGTGVSKSILEPGIYSSGIVGVVTNQEFRKNNARFHRLEQLMQRVKDLESTIKEITEITERKEA